MTALAEGFIYDTSTGDVMRPYAWAAHPGPDELAVGTASYPVRLESARSLRVDLAELALGNLVTTPKPSAEPSLASQKERACARIQKKAELARALELSRGEFQQTDYRMKVDEARAYKVDASPDMANYPLISANVGKHGCIDEMAVADLWLSRDLQGRQALATIGATKDDAMVAIEAATDEAAVEAAESAAVFTGI